MIKAPISTNKKNYSRISFNPCTVQFERTALLNYKCVNLTDGQKWRLLETIKIVLDSETEMARVAHRYTREIEREERKISWARISNSRTVQFDKVLPQKRRGEELREG